MGGDSSHLDVRTLLARVPVGHLVTDPTGTILTANELASSWLGGRSAASPVGLPDLFDDGSALQHQLDRLGRGEAFNAWETAVTAADGTPIPVLVSAMTVAADPDGEAELHWVLADRRGVGDAERNTLERVARRAAYVSEASRRLMGIVEPRDVWRTAAEIVAEYAAEVVLVEAVDDTVVVVRAAAGSVGAPAHFTPVVGREIDSRDPEASVLGVPAPRIYASIQRGDPEIVTIAGEASALVVPLRAHVSARGAMILRLKHGVSLREELLVSRHVAERIALALETAFLFQEVVRARRGAEAASEVEADFLAVVSHEVRTPLTAIVSYAELLAQRADELPDKVAHYAHQIAAAAAHHRQLVEQILSYRRLRQGEDGVTVEPLDFRHAAQFAASLTRPLKGQAVDLILDLPEEPVRGSADVGKLRQILANLLTNAIRHTDEGHVRLALEPGDGWVVFRVEDTGEGIPAESLPRIFDRFWRGPARTDQPRGSGLGLTITKELVDRMGGEIEVASEPGVGTTISVRLPRRWPAQPV
jgi:signal transduction histidine kinase